jgi:hypothetical protein
VDASEAFGNPLVYQWRATDGNIVDPDAVSTDWILPNGPGIHFAYVLVSNGKGGFAEDRIAVNTDGNPTTTMLPRDEYPPAQQLAPVPSPDPSPDAPQIKGTMRLEFGADCGTRSPFFDVYVTAQVILFDNMFRVLNAATLNPYADGQFALYNPGNGAFLLAICDGAIDFFTLGSNNPLNIFTIHGTTRPEVRSMSAKLNGANVGIYPVGPVFQQLPSDDLARRETGFFVAGPPSRFLAFKGLDSRKGACKYYKAVAAVEDCDDAGNYVGRALTFREWRQAVGIAEFSPLGLEAKAVFINKADLNLTRDHHSISYGHDAEGNIDLAAYVCNHPAPAANSNSDPTGLFPSSSAIDAAIDAVLQVDATHPQGRNLVACVAMDRVPLTDFAGRPVRSPIGKSRVTGRPTTFTRFLIFGPNGDLLPSVNLDGNGEKFVPGACVACHGGERYFALANGRDPTTNEYTAPAPSAPIFGGFPEDDSGEPDLQSYFLPYDVGNFAFHSKHPLTADDQHNAIYTLNAKAFDVNTDLAFTNNPVEVPPQATAFYNLFFWMVFR